MADPKPHPDAIKAGKAAAMFLQLMDETLEREGLRVGYVAIVFDEPGIVWSCHVWKGTTDTAVHVSAKLLEVVAALNSRQSGYSPPPFQKHSPDGGDVDE